MGRGVVHRAGRRPVVAPLAEPVIAGQRLSRSQRERLALAEGLAAGGWRDRQRAAHIVRVVEAELAAVRLGQDVERGIEDTLARADARGEAFEVDVVDVGDWRRDAMGGLVRRDGQPVLDVQRVRRASRVDGLASLMRAGSLTVDEVQAAETFRVLYDQARPPVSVSGLEPSAGGGVDSGRMLVQVAMAGRALADIGIIRAWIVRETGGAAAADVVEAVAGRGVTIASMGTGGNAKASNLRRLKAGLAAVKAAVLDLKQKRLANQAR